MIFLPLQSVSFSVDANLSPTFPALLSLPFSFFLYATSALTSAASLPPLFFSFTLYNIFVPIHLRRSLFIHIVSLPVD